MTSYFKLLLVFQSALLTHSTQYERVYPPVDETDVSTRHVYIGLLVSFGQLLNSSGNAAGVRVALDMINEDPYMLQDYTLHYVLSDSQCNRAVANKAFLEQMLNAPTKLALIGSGCSVATEPTAELSSYFNITQLSCSTASHQLTDRGKFPYYFQLLPTIADIAPVYDGISKEFNWNHIAFIVQDENLFTVKLKTTMELLDRRNVSHSVNMFDTSTGISSLERPPFDNPDERIFIITSYQNHALDLLCEWYEPDWWKDDTANLSCTVQERESVLNNSLGMNFIVSDLLQDINSTTMGINGSEYRVREDDVRFNFEKNLFSQYCFDATWSFAYALNKTLDDVMSDPTVNQELANTTEDPSKEFTLDHFSYSSSLLVERMFRYLDSPEQSFDGVTGDVSFDKNGIRIANLLSVYQYRYVLMNGSEQLQWNEIGRFSFNKSSVNASPIFQYLDGESVSSVWPDGVPTDGVIRREFITILLYLTVILSALTSVGLVFTVVCLAFNFFLRKRKLVRMTSPNLNYFIILGAVLYYIDVYFYVLPATEPQLQQTKCTVTTWLTALGYSFSFGPIVAKMFRVWFIFRKPNLKKKIVHDWKLAVGVLLLVGVDLIILIVYNAVQLTGGHSALKMIPSKEFGSTKINDIPIMYVSHICDSTIKDIIFGIFFGYKSLVQVVALLLAFLTRKVKVKGLDDSKFIAAIIYINSIALAVIFICSYTLKKYINIFAGVISVGILVAATSILALVFIPKMIGLYRDPKGENIFSNPDRSVIPDSTGTAIKGTTGDSIDTLKSRVRELEVLLAQRSKAEVSEGACAATMQ